MKFFLIGDKETVTGFSLTGIEGVVAEKKSDALKALQQAVNRPGIGVILITERLAREIQIAIDNLMCDKRKCRLILQIPDIDGPLSCRRSLEQFVLSALGVKV